MKQSILKRIFALALMLAMLFTLCACGEDVPEGPEPDMPPASAGIHRFDALGFTLNFPEAWDGRFRTEENDTLPAVEVWIDDARIFSIASLANDAEIAAQEETVRSAGYSYFSESADHTFYWKIEGDVPDDLSVQGYGPDGHLTRTENDIYHLFSFADTDGSRIDDWLASLIDPYQSAYRNDRLGISLQFPQDWKGHYLISPSEDRIGVFYRTNDGELTSDRTVLFQILRGIPDDWGDTSSLILLAENGTDKYYLHCTGEAYFSHDEAAKQYPQLFTDTEAQVREMFSLLEP